MGVNKLFLGIEVLPICKYVVKSRPNRHNEAEEYSQPRERNYIGAPEELISRNRLDHYLDDVLKHGLKENGGKLCDIAPTMLKILDLPQPEEMSGKSIIE